MYNVDAYCKLHEEVFGYGPAPLQRFHWMNYSGDVQMMEWDALQNILKQHEGVKAFNQRVARVTALGVCEGVAVKCIVEGWFNEKGIVNPTETGVNEFESTHNLPYGHINVDLILN